MSDRPAPARPSLASPAVLIATGLGTGYLPKAPGTWGSLLAAVLAWPIAQAGGTPALLVAAVLATGVGTWATGVYMARTGTHDPGSVVIDEVAGQWLALALCPLHPLWWVVAFVAFRAADITKPFPANRIDRDMRSPFGVMLDDLVAGAYAALVVWIAAAWLWTTP
ncbi:phosphatidylglycerophosphatase A family protein [Thalassobaculum litoreum]|uniref:Phosphatidylglycerophosphatase A n=1 Tax=Thalassobaculum litoreum DSM 18839 TaxID=1123362 RepID=A0A8G2EWT2_9PROT|nr:phosphatidylglycerophosphatase A [Thalassobaculum litoreum]SDF11419.1 phosphatidylglycerophosphatase A [Thalassobaculum litoreum DSM 18839]